MGYRKSIYSINKVNNVYIIYPKINNNTIAIIIIAPNIKLNIFNYLKYFHYINSYEKVNLYCNNDVGIRCKFPNHGEKLFESPIGYGKSPRNTIVLNPQKSFIS